jgi:FkbM family methyltransferase
LIDLNERIFFERRLRRIYKRLSEKPFETIIDVGANKGQTIDFFKKQNKACQVFAFEPNPSLFEKLKAKYFYDMTIQTFNSGISNEVGKKTFYQNVLDYTSSFETLNYDSEYLGNKAKILGTNPEEIIEKTYEVETTTLACFINSHVTQPIDLLKLDVEGHEYACLLGLFSEPLRFQVKYIQLEKHNDDMYENQIDFAQTEALLRENNYKLGAVVRHGFGKLEEVIFVNQGESKKS